MRVLVVVRRRPRWLPAGWSPPSVCTASELRRIVRQAQRPLWVIDTVSHRARRPARLFTSVFLTLPGGSRYTLRSSVLKRAPRLRRLAAAPRAANLGGRRWRELGLAVAAVRRTPGVLAFTRANSHLRIVGERAVTRPRPAPVIAGDLRLRVLRRLPGGVIPAGPAGSGRSELRYPPVSCRHYSGGWLSLAPVNLLTHDSYVLPDSFRWPSAARNRHPRLRLLPDGIARPKADLPIGEPLAGDYYYWDYNHPGHYGHLMTEALCRLWGWDEAKRSFPDLKLLARTHPRDAHRVRARPDATILAAFGIQPDDVTWVSGAVRVRSLVGATPLWQSTHPCYVHPLMRETLDRLSWVSDRSELSQTPTRIFVTRREGNRLCGNYERVEELFASQGYAIVRPAQYDVPDQARIFRDAEVVAGFGGTGMFNLAFASKAEHVVLLNQDAYDAYNETLFATLLRADLHTFTSSARLSRPTEKGFSYRAFQSDWEFDFARHESALTALLRRLA